MKRYLVTRCDADPDNRVTPNSIRNGFDALEEAEEYIKESGSQYHYQIYEGVCSYNRFVELRKTPIFSI